MLRSRTDAELREYIEATSAPIPWTGCWIWLGCLKNSVRNVQYGSITRGKEKLRSNRAAWVAYNGSIPDGLYVLHTCDVTLCVNPKHLYLGTQQQNVKDRKDRKRTAKANAGRYGERSFGHKYSDAQRAQVVMLRTEGLKHKEIAAAIGMHEEYVARLCRKAFGAANKEKGSK